MIETDIQDSNIKFYVYTMNNNKNEHNCIDDKVSI